MRRNYRLVLLAILLMIIVIATSACVKIDETTHIDEKTESARYYLYRVNDSNKYLKFLEDFDEKNYEIVDISISCGQHISESWDTVYCVTYRCK